MTFSDEELSDIIQEIRKDKNYFSNSDSILDRCTFRLVDDKHLDDVAVDSLTGRELQFSIIGRIIKRSTFLMPEGTYWRGGGVLTPYQDDKSGFTGAKLKASLAPPRDVSDVANNDWTRYQTTMAQLINSATPPKRDVQPWNPFRKDKNVFLLSHTLISRKDTPFGEKESQIVVGKSDSCKMNSALTPSGEIVDDPIEDAEEVGIPDQVNLEQSLDNLMHIRDWPCGADWHKVADTFADTHYINPLPAFDDEYELIMPQSYEAKLLGAVAHARFTLSRFIIRGDHVFVGNIVELQVLKPPLGGADIRKRQSFKELVLRKRRKKRRRI